MDILRHIQINIAVNTSGKLMISASWRQIMLPDIVHPHRHQIGSLLQIICNIIDKSGISASVGSHRMSVYKNIRFLKYALKLQLYLFILPVCRHIKLLTIPAIAHIELGCHLIWNAEIVRNCHIHPGGIIVFRVLCTSHITADKFPVPVKVHLCPANALLCHIALRQSASGLL